MKQSEFAVPGLCAHTFFSGRDDPDDAVDFRHECSTVADVVTACLSELPTVDGAAVAIMTGPDARQTVHASDSVIAAVEDLQFLQGQGPCWEAFAAGGPVLVSDLRQAQHRLRWPAYLPAITALGVSAIFAFQVGAGRIPFGVLDLYRSTPGAFTAEQVSVARGYATAAAYALLNSTVLTTEPGESPGDAHRNHIHQAAGMVRVQLNTNSHEALLRLRAHAYATSRELDDVCQDVITRRLQFTVDAAHGT